MEKRANFKKVESIDPHRVRNKELYAKYGDEIKKLTGPNIWSAPIIVGLVSTHLVLSYYFAQFSWPVVVLLAYVVGAFFSHSLYVFMHEATHNLIFKKRTPNKVMNLLCDVPLIFPSSHGFRKYHMEHHRNMGYLDKDADLSSPDEAKLVGANPIKKALWLILFMFVQLFRSRRIKSVKVLDTWTTFNILMVIAIDVAIFMFMGPKPFVYLMCSTIFALGLHPLGGRWIQEHYQIDDDQETYSYYGILNKLSFNVGYHVEHHDIMNIPWNNLPKLKALAPDYYDNLKSYRSWTGVVANFILNPKRSPFDRIIRA